MAQTVNLPPEPINRSITLAKYIEHWVADVGRAFALGRTDSLRKGTFILVKSVLYSYNRIGEMNSSGDVRQLQDEQFCRINSHPARGRKYHLERKGIRVI